VTTKKTEEIDLSMSLSSKIIAGMQSMAALWADSGNTNAVKEKDESAAHDEGIERMSPRAATEFQREPGAANQSSCRSGQFCKYTHPALNDQEDQSKVSPPGAERSVRTVRRLERTMYQGE
jgi:hypothetical protein